MVPKTKSGADDASQTEQRGYTASAASAAPAASGGGGAAAAAAPPPKRRRAPAEERRVVPGGHQAKTRGEFIAFFGGTDEWNKARRA